jgi:hypothetical protein
MRSQFMFLFRVVPSPNSSGRNMDIFLRSLID